MRPSDGTRVVELPPGSFRAAFLPATFSSADRTVEVVWTTGYRVPRFDFLSGEPFLEELSLEDGAVDLTRLNNGAPVLNAHHNVRLEDQIGVVEHASIDRVRREGHALVRFSGRSDVAPILADVKDGIHRNISIAYRTRAATEIERATRETPAVMMATDWEPLEISFVPIGADPGAHVRSHDTTDATAGVIRRYPCTITLRRDGPMAEDVTAPRTRQERPPDEVPPPQPAEKEGEQDEHDDDEDGDESGSKAASGSAGAARASDPGAAEYGTLAERRRAREISEVVGLAGLSGDFARGLIDEGIGVDVARSRIFDVLREQQPLIRAATVRVGHDRAFTFRNGVQNVLLHKLDPVTYPLTAEGRSFVGWSALEMGREWLRVHGRSTDGWSRERIAARALRVKDFDALLDVATRQGPQAYLVTDDFVSVLLNLARASLTQGYMVAPRTFTGWARATTLPDFRIMNRISMGLAPKLQLVPQHGEYTRGALPSRAETMQLGTFGKIIAFTRQAMVNDDLGALTRIPQLFGNSAATMEGDVVYGVLLGNPTMSDGNALFSSAHGNLGTPSAITVTSMAEARKLLRVQTSPDGQYLNLTPAFLLCGPQKELEALQLTASIVVPTTLGTAIPVALKSVEVVIDARITGLDWYIIASPGAIDTIEYAYLDGAGGGGPTLEARDGFDVDGVEFKAREDFGAAAIEWRGMVHNVGA
jgi:hypothetical protein